MRRAGLLLALTSLPLISRAQEPLSFEPGGKQACARAVEAGKNRIPEDSPLFLLACDQRDLDLEQQRFNALSRSMDSRGPEERVAFIVLMVSFAAFRDAHLAAETGPSCAGGSGCGELLKADKVRTNYDFLTLAGGSITPSFTAEDLAAADAALNLAYQKAFDSLPLTCPADRPRCVSQPSLRDTQRDWIRYRDAWVTFAALRWPGIGAQTWLTYLTRQRCRQLDDEAIRTGKLP